MRLKSILSLPVLAAAVFQGCVRGGDSAVRPSVPDVAGSIRELNSVRMGLNVATSIVSVPSEVVGSFESDVKRRLSLRKDVSACWQADYAIPSGRIHIGPFPNLLTREGDVYFTTQHRNRHAVVIGLRESTEAIVRQKALRTVFPSITDLWQPLVPFDDAGMVPECALRTMVAYYGSGASLVEYDSASIPPSRFAEIAMRSIELYEKLHSIGLAHGEVRPISFFLGDPADIRTSMRFSVFARITAGQTGYRRRDLQNLARMLMSLAGSAGTPLVEALTGFQIEMDEMSSPEAKPEYAKWMSEFFILSMRPSSII